MTLARRFISTKQGVILIIALASWGCSPIWGWLPAKNSVKVKVHVAWEQSLDWDNRTKGGFSNPSVVVCDETVYAVSQKNVIHAFQKQHGVPIWKTKLDDTRVTAPICLSKEKQSTDIALANERGEVSLLEGSTGKIKWHVQLDSGVRSRLAYDKGVLYALTSTGQLFALQEETGSVLWNFSGHVMSRMLTLDMESCPVVHKGVVYASFPDGNLAAVDAETGAALWSYRLSQMDQAFYQGSTPVVVGSSLFVSYYMGGVYGFDLPTEQTATGSIGSVMPKWSYLLSRRNNPHAGYLIADEATGKLCVTLGTGGIHCLDMAGHVVWRQHVTSSLSALATWNHVLFFGSSKNDLYGVDLTNGKLVVYEKQVGPGISQPVVSKEQLFFVSSNPEKLYAMDLKKDPSSGMDAGTSIRFAK